MESAYYIHNLLTVGDLRNTVRERSEITDKLQHADLPVYEAALAFQEEYGGRVWQFGMPGLSDCRIVMDLFSSKKYHRCLPEAVFYNGQYMLKCIYDYRRYEDNGYYLGENGAVYSPNSKNSYSLIANNMNELLEFYGIVHEMLKQQPQWQTYSLYDQELKQLLNVQNTMWIPVSSPSNPQFWWRSEDYRCYLCVYNSNGEISWHDAQVYTADRESWKSLQLKSSLSGRGFPFYAYYNWENEQAYIENSEQMYVLNDHEYYTADYGRVYEKVHDVMDVYDYLAGNIKYSNHQPISALLDHLSSIQQVYLYDRELLEYAHSTSNELILQLIQYIKDRETLTDKGRGTSTEQNVYYKLFYEYMGRLRQFSVEYNELTHPLQFYFGSSIEEHSESDLSTRYPWLNDITGRQQATICHTTLKYMELAYKGDPKAVQALHIMEPLLLFAAVGGSIRMDHGLIEVGSVAIRRDQWLTVQSSSTSVYDMLKDLWHRKHWYYALYNLHSICWHIDQSDRPLASFVNYRDGNDIDFIREQLRATEEDYHFLFQARLAMGEPNPELLAAYALPESLQGTLFDFICISYLQWADLTDRCYPKAAEQPCLYHPCIQLLIEKSQKGYKMNDLYEEMLQMLQVMAEQPMMNYSSLLSK